jgi:hypothetical protein
MLASDVGNSKKNTQNSLLYSVLHPGLVYIARPLLVTGSAIWSSVMFFHWPKNRKNRTVLSRQQYMIPWLTVLLEFVIILTISYLIAMMEAYLSHNLKLIFALRLLHLFSGIGLTGWWSPPFFSPPSFMEAQDPWSQPCRSTAGSPPGSGSRLIVAGSGRFPESRF